MNYKHERITGYICKCTPPAVLLVPFCSPECWKPLSFRCHCILQLLHSCQNKSKAHNRSECSLYCNCYIINNTFVKILHVCWKKTLLVDSDNYITLHRLFVCFDALVDGGLPCIKTQHKKHTHPYGAALVIITCIQRGHPTPPEPVPDPAVGSGQWPWLPVVDRNPGPNNKQNWLKTHCKSTSSCHVTSCPRGKMSELYLQHQAFQEDRVPVRILGDVCESPPSVGQQILKKKN